MLKNLTMARAVVAVDRIYPCEMSCSHNIVPTGYKIGQNWKNLKAFSIPNVRVKSQGKVFSKWRMSTVIFAAVDEFKIMITQRIAEIIST